MLLWRSSPRPRCMLALGLGLCSAWSLWRRRLARRKAATVSRISTAGKPAQFLLRVRVQCSVAVPWFVAGKQRRGAIAWRLGGAVPSSGKHLSNLPR
eukprot:814119-Amphidinium_carterae.2